ncbi:MAG: CDP-glycerol glycerophosphotransferase family protein, partial [Firmicutes bacterium]|nr:CDP-glycerol glycerophosphotransferase family protein [Bacillota bacterium]
RFTVKGKKEQLKVGRHSRLLDAPNAFIETDDLIIKKVSNEIRVYQKSFKMVMACRYRFNKTLKEAGKEYLIPVRKRAIKNKKRKEKPVVMIADRVNMARDNGEALFKYLMANGYDKDYDIYFSVIKESDDYSRMSQYGKVLDFGSEEYKDVFLTADYILSSGFDQWFTNAFDADWKYMTDLYEFEHVFLQHGVTMNDWSKELNSSKRGFKLFCTVNREERNMLLGEQFGYYPEEVILSGFPRYDSLVDEREKLIVFAPSWRFNLAGPVDKERGSRFYSDKILGSDYHTFYDGLINDERLCSFMKEHGFKGEFYLHPSFISNDSDFHGNDVVKVLKQADYNRVFRKASILVTDYSSVNVDFAYLNKPVIYSQFDKDTFFDNHACKPGYFDYEKDGFGPVCTTIDQVVDYIIDRIKNDCRSEEKYVERADKFFAYRDRNNCRRVAEAIFGGNESEAIGTTSSRSYKVMDGVLETEKYMTDTQGNNLCVHVLKLDNSADVSYKASCNSYYR